MVLSSLTFIFIFLPVFLLLYWVTPGKWKSVWLVVASLAFYLYGTLDHPFFIVLLVASVIINFLAGRAMLYYKEYKKKIFVAAVVYNLLWLFVFKYTGFVIDAFLGALGLVFNGIKLPGVKLILPLGISFYTFQSISYIADIYRDKSRGARSLTEMAAFICMFPKLTSGPIARFEETRPGLRHGKLTFAGFEEGAMTFTLGLGMKAVLANQIGKPWSNATAIGFESISTPLAWLGIIAYSLQLYYDFCGYSMMALGIGQMMGIQLPVNFEHPYAAVSMTDFWRRWHISLGAWFRDYVYIPLGGNRVGKLKNIRNLLIVWLLTGLWHGAKWNFVLWGAVLFVLIAIEKLGLKKLFDRHHVIGHIYMFFAIPLSWLFFAVDKPLSQLWQYFGRLFGASSGATFGSGFASLSWKYFLILAVGLVCCTGWPMKYYKKYKQSLAVAIILLAIFWLSIYCLYQGMNDPFMYFSF